MDGKEPVSYTVLHQDFLIWNGFCLPFQISQNSENKPHSLYFQRPSLRSLYLEGLFSEFYSIFTASLCKLNS